jgi:diadenosine tetraphosphatase ApaH/serine/threonine PP2A family protein phosphatase
MRPSFQLPYDIIGDIHGHADKLEALLRKLGYRESARAWRHPERQAIFVGDFIDRGPAQIRSVNIARGMVDAGAALAVMGNHELNAIAWHTPDPREPGEYLRRHNSPKWGDKNRQQHAAFLAEVEHDPALHATLVDWFLTLPLWLDLPGLKVVHACWHGPFMSWLEPQLHQGRNLTRDLMIAATMEPEDETEKDNATPSIFKAVEALTKGIELPLPGGHAFRDKDGHVRNRVRVRWWDEGATTYRSAAMMTSEESAGLPELPIPSHARLKGVGTPVFFGHYWLTGKISLQSNRSACLDYSAGKGGPLVAYRFDGESDLSAAKFLFVE